MVHVHSLSDLYRVECPDSTFRTDSELIFARAKGSRVWDHRGMEFLDLCAGFGVHALGHNPDAYLPLWQQQTNQDRPPVIHAMGDVYPSVDKIEFLNHLISLMPPHLKLAGLALAGGQAVEFALKTAILSKNKPGIIAFRQAYHGLDFGSLAITFREDFRTPFTKWLAPCVQFIDYASNLDVLKEQFLSAIERLKEEGGLAAVIMEPIQGRGGMVDPGPTWRREVSNLAHEHNALLILDEVFTGLGRTGRITFADELAADLICLGKPLGGGLPLSACVGTQDAMAAWPENQGEAIHTGTFFGHPLACRLGSAFLNELRNQSLCNQSLEKGHAWRNALRESLQALDVNIQVRGQGLMIGIDYQQPNLGVKVWLELQNKHVITLPSSPTGQVLSLTPALNISSDELTIATEKIVAATEKVLVAKS